MKYNRKFVKEQIQLTFCQTRPWVIRSFKSGKFKKIVKHNLF